MKKILFTLMALLLSFFTYCNSADDANKAILPLLSLSAGQLMDVHGAGAQRSDPKSGDPGVYAGGHGPQGDVVYIYNYARCVRGTTDTGKTYPIVDTGQDKCYGSGTTGVITCPSSGAAFYGQDAAYSGLTASYTDNGDDTITDNNTGLMWEKTYSKVEWANAPAGASSAFTGGHTDWRVPTIKELYSLMNFNGATGTASPDSSSTPLDAVPYLDTTYFDFVYGSSPARYIDAQYITSTAYVSTVMNNQSAFFGVNFADGRIKGYPQSGNPIDSTYYVRYVRNNTNYGNNSFTDNGDNTITDNATGLTWMKIDSGSSSMVSSVSSYTKTNGSLNWEEALHFCENQSFAGRSDWRLPDAKELHTIVDYTRSPDTTDSAAIDPVFSITSIIDNGGDKDYPYFWTSTTHLDGQYAGEWAVYIAFGEAEGYFSAP